MRGSIAELDATCPLRTLNRIHECYCEMYDSEEDVQVSERSKNNGGESPLKLITLEVSGLVTAMCRVLCK